VSLPFKTDLTTTLAIACALIGTCAKSWADCTPDGSMCCPEWAIHRSDGGMLTSHTYAGVIRQRDFEKRDADSGCRIGLKVQCGWSFNPPECLDTVTQSNAHPTRTCPLGYNCSSPGGYGYSGGSTVPTPSPQQSVEEPNPPQGLRTCKAGEVPYYVQFIHGKNYAWCK
jgi:hypothetical protein